MKVAKRLYKDNQWVKEFNLDLLGYHHAQLVIGFGERSILTEDFLVAVKKDFPNAEIALCSSSGEIFCNETFENSVSLAAVQFSSSRIHTTKVNIKDFKNSFDAGDFLMESLLNLENLKWVFVLSDGSDVNGSELVKGLNNRKPDGVLVSGGLAGDGNRFKETIVGLNEVPKSGNILAIGFYGDQLQLSHASVGGWETFGLERTVTKSKNNYLYEIDGKNALDLYKKYLGKYSEDLPGSALLFPLSLKVEDKDEPIVRTILSIDDDKKIMVFAGDIPQGSKVRFMKANLDTLVDAANIAATECVSFNNNVPQLSILVSCVGRKLVLGNRISEEVDAVKDVYGVESAVVGFYSYGEISPLKPFENCELHNQTITITGIKEIE